MGGTNDDDATGDSDGAVGDMMKHLDDAKDLDASDIKKRRQRKTRSGRRSPIERRTDVAVLASNFESRLEEMVAKEAVTHRSSKVWKSAKLGVDEHGRLPIYYRSDGEVAYKGYVTRMVLNPTENAEEAEEFVQHISEGDTYGEYNDEMDRTTYIVADGERLEEPFSQSELRLLLGEGTVDENYSRQPAYVIQRPGDFPDFP